MRKLPEQVWVFAGSFVFFLLTLAENFSGPHDSITYLNGIVDGYPLVNQHHLLYHYTAYAWLQCWQAIFPGIKNYYLVEAFSALWGSCSIAVVYSFFKNRFNFSGFASVAALLPVMFSYGFWFYSVNVEVYAPPLFFILLALYLITKPQLLASDWYKIFLLHILAIVFHQVNVLFAVVILWKLWEQRTQAAWMKLLMVYAISGIILVGGAYFIVGWVVEKQNSVEKWVSWMRGYAGADVYWHKLDAKTPVNIGYGFSHAFLGGHYVFQVPPVKTMLSKSLSAHSLGDEIFIARSISSSMAILLSVLTGILALGMGWLLIRFLGNFKKLMQSGRQVLTPLLICFFTYSAFFVFWMPEILEFWILQTVLIWLLFIGTLNRGAASSVFKPFPVALTLGFLLFCINYFGSIRWMQEKENDLYYVKTKTIEEAAGEKDLVILQEGWIVKDFLHYFTQLNVQSVPMKDSSQSAIDSMVNKTLASQGKLWILPEINNKLKSPDTRYLDSLRKEYAGRLRLYREKDPEIWMIQ